MNCIVTIKLGGVPQSHATPHMTPFQPCLYYPLLSCLLSMHKKLTPRLNGCRGRMLTHLSCFYEQYNGIVLYFITNSYLLLACFYVGFLYTLVQKLIFLILTHNQKKLCRKCVEHSTKRPKLLNSHPLQKLGRGKMIISRLYADIIS